MRRLLLLPLLFIASLASAQTTTVSGVPTPIVVGKGGTGQTTLTAHGVVVGNGTTAVNVTGAGTTGQVLTSNGAAADPTFQTAAGGSTPTGTGFTHITAGVQDGASSVPTLASTLIDLNNVWTVIDDNANHTGTLISATAKPGSPQYTKTILTANLPVNTSVTDYEVFFCIGGSNTDVSTRTINWRFTLNGTDIGSSDGNIPPAAGKFWVVLGRFQANAIANGDVLGVKLWASVTNVVDYRDVTIYILPRNYLIPASGCMAMVLTSGVSGAISGAIAGTTYNNPFTLTNPGSSVYDSGISSAPLSSSNPNLIGYPQFFTQAAAPTDNNGLQSSGSFSSQTLYVITSIARYFRQWKIQ
jgi:hypothetical protein